MPFSGAERDCHRAVTAVWPTDALVEVSADFTEGVHLERGEPDAKEGLQSSCDTPLDLRGPAPSLKVGGCLMPAAFAKAALSCLVDPKKCNLNWSGFLLCLLSAQSSFTRFATRVFGSYGR